MTADLAPVHEEKPFGGGFLFQETGVPIMSPESFTEEQRMFARTARDFSEKEILSRVKEIEERGAEVIPALLRKAGEVGLLMVDIPEAYGGLGRSKTTSMLIAEQFGRVGSFAVSLGAHTGIGTLPIVYFGTEEQKHRYLPALASGELLAAYALTEPEAGSDALAAKTRAVPDGDAFVLDGNKQFITNGGFADLFIVFAQIEGSKFTAFIVERRMGVESGREEDKMGIRGSSTCPLLLRGVRVPRQNVLGEIGQGHKIAFNTLNLGRLKLGVGVLGSAKWSLALSTEYALGRRQFGRPIASFGLVRDKLAEMALRIFVTETIGYRTTGLVDHATADAHTAAEQVAAIEEFAVESSMAKVYGSEMLNFVVDEAVQIHGGYGFIEDYHVARQFRDSRINRIFEGTNEVNRLIIPGTLLRRAAQGKLPLLPRAFEVRHRVEAGAVPEVQAGPLGVERQVEEFTKWITLYTTAVVVEKYQLSVKDEQEALGVLADMMTATYCLDSVTDRCFALMVHGTPRQRELARHLLVAYAPRAYAFVVHSARHLLMDIFDGEELERHLTNVSRMRIEWPSKVMEAKRALAARVLEVGGYPFP
jgi:alkylation response protein AidB-like acyl-CoA dehydrogenase